MKKYIITAAIAASLAAPAAATIRENFNDGKIGPLIEASGDFAVVEGNIPGQHAAPVGYHANKFYYTTYQGESVIRISDFKKGPYKKVSFVWGSVDSYNTLQVLNREGVIIQTFNFQGTGDQGPNGTMFFEQSFLEEVGALRFITTSNSFEIDNLVFSRKAEWGGAGGNWPGPGVEGAVPEPETWATLVLGFGVVGAIMRRRRVITAY